MQPPWSQDGNRVCLLRIRYGGCLSYHHDCNRGGRQPFVKQDMSKKAKEELTLPKELEGEDFAIRKLTPRECFRLMDVDDEYIDKIQQTKLSNSAQYKLAGNSIVVSCLYHAMRKMFIEPEPDIAPGEAVQLSLF